MMETCMYPVERGKGRRGWKTILEEGTSEAGARDVCVRRWAEPWYNVVLYWPDLENLIEKSTLIER